MATADSQKEVHWARTRSLMIVHLTIWFIFSFVVHWFAHSLNQFTFIGFPLGFYMAAQGSLIVFVVQLFIFSKQQEKVDRECGMAEDE
jgi:putative solute:sodium symporter small subunit